MSTASPQDSRYFVPAISAEKERLEKLYAMKKTLYGWLKAVPDAVDLSQVDTVIDIGASTCIWTLDLLSIPEIKARRGKLQIYACDIDAGFFPSSINEAGTTAFQQDVTKPFPRQLQGMFDLIHASFLVSGLTAEGWISALANCRNLLKPDGIILLDETDALFLPEGSESDAALLDEDPKKHLTGDTWIQKANCLYTGYALEKELIVRITSRLGSMLESGGFRVEESKTTAMAMGPLCRSRLGVAGGSLAQYEMFSVENVEHILAHTAAHLFKTGTLEAPKGTRIKSEAEMTAVLKEIGDGIRTEGALALVRYFVARKE
ncbi:hypothetical protein C8R43DRAFT_1138840 [Mycena crocata]|nr:hypothetical protein C8R43DRAFT_1138840 [Mycena crocata]